MPYGTIKKKAVLKKSEKADTDCLQRKKTTLMMNNEANKKRTFILKFLQFDSGSLVYRLPLFLTFFKTVIYIFSEEIFL